MLERSERILKIICLGLAALLLSRVVIAVLKHNPLEHMQIPSMPVLAEASEAKTTGAGTNAAMAKATMKAGTNSVSAQAAGKPGTNAVPAPGPEVKTTNTASTSVTNKPGTNAVLEAERASKGTNAIQDAESAKQGTNSIAETEAKRKGTNPVAGTNAATGTNALALAKQAKKIKGPNPRMAKGKPAAELPPVVQARIDKIVDSEILGQVIRPVPLGLLGIAGEYAFLRAPSGQTGLVKTGDELGGVKLIQIGINRVLVETEGEKKELVIFDGYGSEALLIKTNEKPNETITKSK